MSYISLTAVPINRVVFAIRGALIREEFTREVLGQAVDKVLTTFEFITSCPMVSGLGRFRHVASGPRSSAGRVLGIDRLRHMQIVAEDDRRSGGDTKLNE
ncbi:hypothetical protein F5141DRAFT_1216786 [Pisolithus sp. B1]|nr:hypothetical protein F5141DRAFT_1216786 [Pisolithus sp. B1]